MMVPDNNKLPPVMLPVDTVRLVPVNVVPLIVPVALIKPAVNKLPPVMLAAEVMVEVALINPAVNKLPPVMLPPVIVPVVDITFDPSVAKLELVYPAGNPVN